MLCQLRWHTAGRPAHNDIHHGVPDMVNWSLVIYILEWVVRLVALVVIPRRKEPNSAMAWLLVIFLLPEVGVPLYLLIGNNRLPRRRLERHARLLGHFRTVGRDFADHPIAVRPQLDSSSTAAVTLAERLGYMPILGGNHVDLMSRSDEAVERLIADMEAARHHVHLLFYIFARDATGRRVADALARAVRRGVKCRVLCDGVGSRPMFKRLGKRMQREGIELHPTLPVGLFRRRMARIDLRNHRKIAVIDGRIAYTGSQNIVDPDYGHKNLVWHELMMRLTGPIVLELQAVFLADWYHETDDILGAPDIFPEPSHTGTVAAQTLPSGPNYPTENYQRMVVAAVYAAQQHVTITTPYFVPDAAFMQALQVAVLRGVQVRLLLSRKSDQIMVGEASRAYYHDLLEAGVELHLFRDGLLHAKTILIDDDVAMIGTSNFDIRSFALNFEVNMVFYGAQVAGMLHAQHDRYLDGSDRLTLDQWERRPAAVKVWQNVAKLLSPLL